MPPLSETFILPTGAPCNNDNNTRLPRNPFSNDAPMRSRSGGSTSSFTMTDSEPCLHSSSTTSSTTTTRSVRFNNFCYVLPIDTPSSQERQERWYSQPEYNSFKLDASHTVYLKQHFPQDIDEHKCTYRGLEGREEQQWNQRRVRRQSAVRAVLETQQLHSAEYIAQLYRHCIGTTDTDMAQQDAQDAELYQQECTIVTEDLLFFDWLSTDDNVIVCSSSKPLSIDTSPCDGVSSVNSPTAVVDLFSDDWISEVARAPRW